MRQVVGRCIARGLSVVSTTSCASANAPSSPLPSPPTPVQAYPDAGFIASPGVTGTTCTNLFPIPVLGAYGWFLTVYDRDIASSVGPFVVSVDEVGAIKLGFEPQRAAMKTASNPSSTTPESVSKDQVKVFNGIAAGNLNVKNILTKLNAVGKAFQLKFFERGQSEFFFQRRNELHISPSSSQSFLLPHAPLWSDVAPTYRVIPSLSKPLKNFQVRELYSGAGEQPKTPVIFEWFGMNLFPIFPLAKYSAFVCVWKQDRGSSSVAIDKQGKSLCLNNFDPLPLPDGIETPQPVGLVAVRTFSGAVSDQSVTENHKALLEVISETGDLMPESESDFRICIDNTPNKLTQARKSEIWIKLRS